MTCVRRLAGAQRPAASTPADASRPDPRARRRRAGLSLLPALALLLGALGLFAAAPAQAQTTIWSATLTVKEATSSRHGCWDNTPETCADHLSDTDFALAGETVVVTGFYQDTTNGELNIEFENAISGALKTAIESYDLHVGGVVLSMANAYFIGPGRYIVFQNTGLSWTPGQQVSLSIVGPLPPPEVSNLTVTPGNRKLTLRWTLKWTAPVLPRGDSVVGHDVEYRRCGVGPWTPYGDASTDPRSRETTRVIDGLTPGIAWEVRVRARVRTGFIGSPVDVSDWVSATGTPPGTVFGESCPRQPVPWTPANFVPTDLRVTQGSERLTLKWTAPVTRAFEWISGYDVEYRRAGGGWIQHGNLIPALSTNTDTTRVINGFGRGTAWEVRVRARLHRTGAGELLSDWVTWNTDNVQLRSLEVQR